jgi:TM2 domain-containing membrane protein YozV
MLCSQCDESDPNLAADSQNSGLRPPRKPRLALLLSFFAAGLGQLYNRQYLKGLLFLLASAIAVFGSIILAVTITVIYSLGARTTVGNFGTAAPFVPARAWLFANTDVTFRLLLGSPLVAVSLWIWSMVDAHQTAIRALRQRRAE